MYNRLFTKILDSSIWLEDVNTRIVWITLLAAMDEDGYAHFSALENLALRARVSVTDAQAAVDCLMSPDPNSENPNHEGRRVERVQGGYFILNAAEHRKAMNREIRREQTRLRVAKHREKQECNAASVTGALQSVTSASASASASAKEEGIGGKPNLVPTAEDIYQAYPRHEARPGGLKAINKAIRDGFGRAFLLERTIAYAKTQPTRSQFTPLPATWFNDQRFNDDPREWVREDRNQGKPKQPWEIVSKPKPKFKDLYPT